MQQVRLVGDEEQHFGGDAVRGAPGEPVLGVDPDLEVDEARGQRRRHAMHHAAVGLAVAAGDERGAFGERVLADLGVEDELVERRLDHRDGGGQLLQVDEPAAGVVRRRQKGRRRPARAVGRIAPGDAAEIDGIEQERADVDVAASRFRRDLLGDLRLGGAGRAPDDAGLTRLDQEGEHGRELARAQRVVRGDGDGLGHRRAPSGGETERRGTPLSASYGRTPGRRLTFRLLLPLKPAGRNAERPRGKAGIGLRAAVRRGEDRGPSGR